MLRILLLAENIQRTEILNLQNLQYHFEDIFLLFSYKESYQMELNSSKQILDLSQSHPYEIQ